MIHEDREPKGYISAEDIQLLIDNSFTTLKEIIYCLIYTGCRISEILSLTCQQIDFDRKIITLTTKDSKRKGRIITKPIADELLHMLMEKNQTNKFVKSQCLFPNPDDRSIHIKSIRTAWNAACRRAGLVDITPHKLRHTFASWLLMKTGGDIKVVSRLVGHSSIGITSDYYAHLSDEYLRSAVNIIGEIVPVKTKISNS